MDLTGLEGSFVGLDHFRRIASDALLWKALANTAVITAIAVSLELVLGLGAALAVHGSTGSPRASLGKTMFRNILIMPMVLPPIAVAIVWRLMYDTNYGVINGFLSYFGLGPVPWLSDPALAVVSLILTDAWQWTPFMFLVLLAGLTALPEEPYEAAMIDGASAWQQFRDLTLPLLRPVILVAVLIRMMDCLRLFDTVYVLTRGGPGNATETISYFIYRTAYENFDLGYAAAVSFLTLFLTLFLSKLFLMILGIKERREPEDVRP